ncbi:HAMP domain-containing sensor histidine kinase [Aeromicrobium sp.]|uniref:sensor histidine kinase n=1 Tax=Aeromicrobium sp. TaxID=1871063 RepID=UPI0025C3CBF5|nr:HAMP domain-containing sensor histidine kinase [Aeromicrobium sp.]MCK5891619.1 HAMP domain-containing histidine kinase [Aeromicrobium sp.]
MRSTALVTAVAMALVVTTVLLVLAALTRDSVTSSLEDRLDLVLATAQAGDGDSGPGLDAPDDAIDEAVWVFDATGQQVRGPNAGRNVQETAESLADVTRRTSLERRERLYLAAPVPASTSGDPAGVVVVSESLEPYERTRNVVAIGLVALGVIVTAGSSASAAWTVRRALAPVGSMATRAEEWSEHDLDSRFATVPGRGDEIAVLGETLNLLLDRVAGALRGEQRLTAELAHELRTPLTALRGEAEIALMMEPQERVAERLREVIALVERMSTTITTLLDVARGEGDRGATCDPLEIARAVLADQHERSGVSIRVDIGDDLPDTGAPLALASRALAPLVDNAVAHASSGVTLTAAVRDRRIEISVTDDGPGVVAELGEALFTPGVHGPGSTGAGLGLALARRVARSLGGDVVLTSDRDPTVFTLTLPQS